MCVAATIPGGLAMAPPAPRSAYADQLASGVAVLPERVRIATVPVPVTVLATVPHTERVSPVSKTREANVPEVA